jgi:hypothetical protein
MSMTDRQGFAFQRPQSDYFLRRSQLCRKDGSSFLAKSSTRDIATRSANSLEFEIVDKFVVIEAGWRFMEAARCCA